MNIKKAKETNRGVAVNYGVGADDRYEFTTKREPSTEMLESLRALDGMAAEILDLNADRVRVRGVSIRDGDERQGYVLTCALTVPGTTIAINTPLRWTDHTDEDQICPAAMPDAVDEFFSAVNQFVKGIEAEAGEQQDLLAERRSEKEAAAA